MRVARGGWGALLAVVAACGRFDFEPVVGDATTACSGTACGFQCTTPTCFPLELYRDTLAPPDWGTVAAALPTGEVHLVYVDPRTNAVMWLYSDPTLRHWSVPIDLADSIANRMFTSVALLPHDDGSLTALFMDVRAGGSTLYRRHLAPRGTSTWIAEALATVPLPVTTPFYVFNAATNSARTAVAITFATDGNDTTTNAVYVSVSTDKLQTLHAIAQPTNPWDLVETSVAGEYFFEARVALDTTNNPWLLYHSRSGTNDDAVLARFTSAWTTSVPGWGDPWHYAMSIDPADNVQAFFQQEGTTGNPQHAEVRALNDVDGPVSIGNWNWASAPANGYLRSVPSREGTALRLIWEDPETLTLAARDTDGATWGATAGDIVGPVPSTGTDDTSALVVAPQMVNGTSHIFWRDTAMPVGGGTYYTLSYAPFTRCGGPNGPICAPEQGCMGAACVPR